MNRTKEKPVKAEKAAAAKAEKNGKAKKSKEVVLSNGAVDHRLSESFPMIKLIEQRIAESVPKEIIDKVNAVTSKRQIICSTYPYEKCIKNKAYEKEAKFLQIELVKMQGVGAEDRRESGDAFRGPRRGGQGRHDQAVYRISQSARRAGRGVDQAFRKREGPVVFPALRGAVADRGRDRVLRPVLVQPRRRGACDGLLLAPRLSRVHAADAGVRAHAGAQRKVFLQVLVFGEPRGAVAAVPWAARGIR